MPTIEEVFPTAGTPKYTYQSRLELEQKVDRYAKHGSGLLSVFGPTKAGKSVLVRRLMPTALYVRGDVLTEAELWNIASTRLGTYTGRSKGKKQSTSWILGITARISAGWVALTGRAETTAMTGFESGQSASDDTKTVVLAALAKAKQAIIIDDFHFMPRAEQKKVMAAVKGFIDDGHRAVIITAEHRAHQVGSLIGNMAGRITPAPVPSWETDDLEKIAVTGFKELKIADPTRLASILAENSFGSPQLMQRLCQALCRANDILETQTTRTTIQPPQPSWEAFYRDMLSRVDPEMRWVSKLTRGPLRHGTQRNTYPTTNYGLLDGYGLVVLAIAQLLPSMELKRAAIQDKVAELIAAPRSPRNTETASKLQYLSDLAGEPLDEAPAIEGDSTGRDKDGLESDPVLEYEESGATSVLRLVDPLFAFALKWGDNPLLPQVPVADV